MLVKIKDICNITMGQSPKSKYYSNTDGFPFLQGNRTFGLKYPFIDTYTTKITKKAKVGSILISVRAPVGDLNIANQEICIGRGIASLEAIDGDNEFLYYALKSNMNNILNKGNGTTYDSITVDALKEIEINIPNNKQSREKISKILSGIDNQIERNNAMTKRLQDMILTRYSIIFQNKKSKNALLKDICLLPSGYNFKPKSYNDCGKYKLITIKNVCDTFVDDVNTDKLSEVPNIKDYCYLNVGDVLLSLTGNVCRISIVHSKDNLLNQRVSLLQAKGNYKIYSYCLLKSQEYQFIMTNIARGTSQKNLSPIDVENLKVYAPTFEEIKAFNENTENYFNEMLTIKQSTETLIKLKNNLLPLLINGQLDV